MMKVWTVLLVVLICALPQVQSSNDGTICAACQIVVALFERLAIRYQTNIKNATEIFCNDVAPKFIVGDNVCSTLTEVIAPIIELDYTRKLPPTHTCLKTLKLCSAFPTCTLYTTWPPPSSGMEAWKTTSSSSLSSSQPSAQQGWSELAKELRLDAETAGALKQFFLFFPLGIGIRSFQLPSAGPIDNIEHHLPIEDLDNDRFSSVRTLRGSDWRGRDCEDGHSDVYPGRKLTTLDDKVDHNCNGIYGTDQAGVSFEDKFCKDTGNIGVIAIGDSATAHFRVPPDWLNAAVMDNTTYQHAIPVLENELDWPMCSSTTAHRDQSYCPQGDLEITSIYLKLRERNRCNHRDYQNLGVNGARTTNTAPPDGDVLAMKARNGTDQPALVLYAMIGNDVCSGHHDFDHMTKPAEFEQKVVDTLEWLDKHLAPGSHVILSGLVDGRILYDTMHALEHPVGTTYEDVYDFLNCVEVSPCWGWMNSNQTVRNMTSQTAATLNSVYSKIIKEHAYDNFDMFYVDTYSILDRVVKQWVASGKQARDLIEPTDGFHPSQTANTLLAENLWDALVANFSQAIGKENPHNQDIEAKFGDQGGY